MKKDIARINTALRERELMREYAGVDDEAAVAAATVETAGTPQRRSLLGRLGRGRK